MKTKLLICFILLLLAFSLAACQENIRGEDKAEKNINDKQETLVSVLEQMDALIAPSNLADSSLQNTPWIKSQVEINALDRSVSMNVIEEYIYAYRYYRADEFRKSGSDLIKLFNQDNEEDYQSFLDFFQWVMNNGPAKLKAYRAGTSSAYMAYKEIEDEAYNGKTLSQLEAADAFDLALWVLVPTDCISVLTELPVRR